MPVQHLGVDFVAYSKEGAIVLLAEAKTRLGTSAGWASKLRRNMLERGALPPARYFLLVTPDRMYGWSQEKPVVAEIPPAFTIDAQQVLAPYFAKVAQDPTSIGPDAFELLILSWLNDVAGAAPDSEQLDPSLESLSSSGLLASLRKAHIEMNSAK